MLVKCPPGKLIRDSVSSQHASKSSLPEVKWDFNRRRIVSMKHSGTVSHCFQFWEWWEPSRNPSSQLLAKGQPCKQPFLRTAVLVVLCYTKAEPNISYIITKYYRFLEKKATSHYLRGTHTPKASESILNIH